MQKKNANDLSLGLIEKRMLRSADLEQRLRMFMINLLSMVGIAILLGLGISVLREGNTLFGFFDLGIACILVFNQIYMYMKKTYHYARYIVIISIGALFVYNFTTGGMHHSGHLWFFIFPLFTFFLLGSTKGIFVTFAALFVSLVLLYLEPFSSERHPYSTNFVIRFLISFSAVSVCAYFIERFREKTQENLLASNEELHRKISELREAEAALKRNQEELEMRVEERTEVLRNVNQQLLLENAERRKAEELFRASEEKYRLLFENSFDVIYSIDLQFNLTSVSPSVERVLGYRPSELVGKRVSEFTVLPEGSMKIALESISRILKGETIPADNYEFISRDGSIRIAQISSAPLFKEGEVVGLISIARDITAQKRAEEELRAAHDELEIRVAQRTEELKKALEAAEAASRAKSAFLANMSHELRTPLNHIIGFTELIFDEKFGELRDVQKEYLNDVLQSSHHLLSLINDLLDLSKIEAGKMILELSEVNLPVLLKNGLTMINEKALKSGILLSIEIEEIPESIQADERKLKQILYNLLSNAVKFTPEHGKVKLSARPLSFRQNHWEPAGAVPILIPFVPSTEGVWILVEIQDKGFGLNETDMERIFNPFEQADNATSRRFRGTGLGLSLTRKMVELHGGKIWAESEGAGKGSTFRFVIPVQGESPDQDRVCHPGGDI